MSSPLSSLLHRLPSPSVFCVSFSSYTKMGFAGNYEPNYIVPTLISVAAEKKQSSSGGVGSQSAADTTIPDLDFYIGDQASQEQ